MTMMNITYADMPSSMAVVSAQELMDQAAMKIDQMLAADSTYGDLVELLQLQRHDQPSVSGLQDVDYPSLSDPKIGLSMATEMTNIRRVPLPAELMEQFEHMQCNCLMGLFPEISRAWLSIDSDIFVWNYEDGSDLAYFDGLSDTIISAGLVKPKPNIFQPYIEYLLCLTTVVDIVLLGVSFVKPNEPGSGLGEMNMLPEPLFTLPTDNIHMLSVQGSESGRIFMTGMDGCLYELHYQAEDGWFSRKCRKINHSTSMLSVLVPSFLNFSFVEDDPLVQISIDDSRHILYTRSKRGTIQVYDLGEDGNGMSRVAAVSQQTSLQRATVIARTIEKSNFQSIIHIAAIPKTESVNVHLVAITSSGMRLYFTTNHFGKNRGRPCMLTLIHVRLPPGFSASASQHRPSNVHKAHYRKDTLLMASSETEDSDLLWTISPDSFPFQVKLMENYETLGIDGHTWAMAEVPSAFVSWEETALSQGPVQRAGPPLVVTQHMQPPRRFVLLNSQGSYLMTKQSPAEQLKQLLLVNQGPDADAVKAFFSLHKEDQACATCLILACSTLNPAEAQVAEWATRAFFLYGGEPEFTYKPQPHAGAFQTGGNLSFASPLRQGFQPHQISTPISRGGLYNQSFTHQQPSMQSAPEMVFSGRHDGLCLYLARLVRPIWEQRMVSDVPCSSAKGQMQYLASRYRSDELSWFRNQVLALQQFLDRNSQFTAPVVAESLNVTTHGAHGIHSRFGMSRLDESIDEQTLRRTKAECQQLEKASLQNVQQLVHRICESLGLWKILCDHQFHIIASSLTKDQQNVLKTMSFKNFVTDGKSLAGALIQGLIDRYLSDNAATEAISSILRDTCPALYSSDDAICSKANEMLHIAKKTQSKTERQRELLEALHLYKEITSQLDLPTVCTQFAANRFYTGIVDLCLTAATKRDPQGLAVHYYRHREPPEDMQGSQAFRIRENCYRCITETLEFLLSTSQSHPQAPSVPRSPGPPPAPDPNTMSIAEAQQHTDEVFSMCVKQDDEMFHIFLYKWLIKQNLTEKLLDIKSPYLEEFLKRTTSIQPDNLPMLDLLWRHYEKTRNFSAASRILAKLAERHSTDINLQKRLEYLSRATMSAKSATSSGSSAQEGEFLHELEEKMEVGRLQLQVYEALTKVAVNNSQAQSALSRLNAELFDISALYSEFADTFDLSECKIAVIHCAGYYDPTLVESLWQDIIDKELQLSRAAPLQSRMNTLGNKLVSLGRMYAGTERYFPLAFLVKYLETKSCELHADKKFVFTTLMNIGMSVSKLHEIYDRLLKSRDPCWQSLRQPYHLLEVICLLLGRFADAPNLVPAYERRPFTNSCLDAVTGYLVELQANSTGDATVRTLLADYKNLQARLERIL